MSTEAAMQARKERISEYLDKQAEPASIEQIAEDLGLSYARIYYTVLRMWRHGEIKRSGYRPGRGGGYKYSKEEA